MHDPFQLPHQPPQTTAFARALTLLYALNLLTLLTHIQLNLLGTRKYVQSVRRLVREQQRASSAMSLGGGCFLVLWRMNTMWREILLMQRGEREREGMMGR